MATGRPKKEFDKKTFQDLVGLGCKFAKSESIKKKAGVFKKKYGYFKVKKGFTKQI